MCPTEHRPRTRLQRLGESGSSGLAARPLSWCWCRESSSTPKPFPERASRQVSVRAEFALQENTHKPPATLSAHSRQPIRGRRPRKCEGKDEKIAGLTFAWRRTSSRASRVRLSVTSWQVWRHILKNIPYRNRWNCIHRQFPCHSAVQRN